MIFLQNHCENYKVEHLDKVIFISNVLFRMSICVKTYSVFVFFFILFYRYLSKDNVQVVPVCCLFHLCTFFEGYKSTQWWEKYQQQLLDMGLPEEHCDLVHNVEYSKIPFFVSKFLKKSKPIKYAEPFGSWRTINHFWGKGITISFKVRKVLNVHIRHRFTK